MEKRVVSASNRSTQTAGRSKRLCLPQAVHSSISGIIFSNFLQTTYSRQEEEEEEEEDEEEEEGGEDEDDDDGDEEEEE